MRVRALVVLLLAALAPSGTAGQGAVSLDTLRAGSLELGAIGAALDSVYAKNWWPSDSFLVVATTERARHFVLMRASAADSARLFKSLSEMVPGSSESMIRDLFATRRREALILDSLPMRKRHILVDSGTGLRPSAYPHSVRSHVSLTRPVFSQDGTRAIVHIRLHCPQLCSRGDIVSLERRGEHWIVVAVTNVWTS